MGISYKNGFKTIKGTTQRPPEAMAIKYNAPDTDYVRGTALVTNPKGPNYSLDLSFTNNLAEDAAGNTIVTDGASYVNPGVATFSGAPGSKIVIQDSDNFHFGDGDWSVEFRIKLDSLAQQYVVCQSQDFNTNRIIFVLNTGSIWRVLSGSLNVATGNTGMTTGTWYDVKFERVGNTINIYQDGQVEGTGSFSGTIPNFAEPLTIGSQKSDNDTSNLDGQLEYVRITKG